MAILSLLDFILKAAYKLKQGNNQWPDHAIMVINPP